MFSVSSVFYCVLIPNNSSLIWMMAFLQVKYLSSPNVSLSEHEE